MDVASILKDMPPGVNIFDYVESLFVYQLFPEMGTSFWVQCLIAGLLSALIIVLFAVGLVLRAHKRYLTWLVHDGAASHADPLLWIPLLWILEATFIIVLTAVLHAGLTRRQYGVFLGTFWVLAPLPLVISYALLSISLLVSVPVIRRQLVNFSTFTIRSGRSWPSVVLVRGILLVISGAVLGSVYLPALHHGKAMADASVAFADAISIVTSARASGNMFALTNLSSIVDRLAVIDEHNAEATRFSGIAYTCWMSVFVIFTLLPGYFLTRFILARIERYERSPEASSTLEDAELPVHVVLHRNSVPDNPRNSILDTRFKALPKDRPFGGLIDTTTPMLAPEFQAIINDRILNAVKAQRLREKLRQKHYLMVAHVLMLFSFAGWAAFSAADGRRVLSSPGQVSLNYAFYVWSFLVPALASSMLYVWKSLGPISIKSTGQPQQLATTIAVQQRISFAEEVEDDEKSDMPTL